MESCRWTALAFLIALGHDLDIITLIVRRFARTLEPPTR
jgi:hypothetical protein